MLNRLDQCHRDHQDYQDRQDPVVVLVVVGSKQAAAGLKGCLLAALADREQRAALGAAAEVLEALAHRGRERGRRRPARRLAVAASEEAEGRQRRAGPGM